jgi:hypothetical protein
VSKIPAGDKTALVGTRKCDFFFVIVVVGVPMDKEDN